MDTYVEAARRLPSKEIALETADATYYYFKADILSGMVTYSTDKRLAVNATTITAERAFDIIRLNKEGEKPLSLQPDSDAPAQHTTVDLVEQESLTRFDKSKKRKKKRRPAGEKREAKEQPRRRTDEQSAETRKNNGRTKPRREKREEPPTA